MKRRLSDSAVGSSPVSRQRTVNMQAVPYAGTQVQHAAARLIQAAIRGGLARSRIGTAYSAVDYLRRSGLPGYVYRSAKEALRGRQRTVKQQVNPGALRGYKYRSYGRLGGKVKPGRRMTRYMKKRYQKAFNGIEFCEEQVFNITDNRCVYIAHHSQPVLNMAKMMAYALFKCLLNHANVQFSSWSDTALGIIGTADVIGLEYKLTPVSGTAASAWTAPTVTGATTLGSLAELFWLHIRDAFLQTGATILNIGSQFRLTKIYWLEAGTNRNKDQMQLADAKFTCMTRSTLKMQNRSIATLDDDESTDVNNVPLSGRSYDFNGNIIVPRDNVMGNGLAIFTTPSNETGISIIGALSTTVLQEPPPPYFFANKPKSAKITLSPGDIKTSVLNDKVNVNLSTFFRFVNGLLRAASTQLYNPQGKSRMFAFERVIARLPAELEPGITVCTEVDIKFWAEVKAGSGKYTGPLNIVN